MKPHRQNDGLLLDGAFAGEALTATNPRTPGSERPGLEQAIERVRDVSPPPVLNLPPVASAAA